METKWEAVKADFRDKESFTAEDLLTLVRLLRSEEGCPWDRVQTHESIRKNFIEEVWEVAEAIDRKDPSMLCEELGDILFQVAFHTVLAEEDGQLTANDIVSDVCRKMIVRHPHVFGETTVNGTGEVLKNWDEIKAKTKEQKSCGEELAGVAKTLPSLMRAQKIAKKSAKAGKEFGGAEQATALENPEEDALCRGIFALVQSAQAKGIDAEEAMERFLDRNIEAFLHAEAEEKQKV